MATKVFPSVNDMGGGKTITEASLRDFIAGLMAASGSFVVSGLLVPGSSGSLSITIPLGVCYIEGYRIETDATVFTVVDNTTSYLYFQYLQDGSANINLVAVAVNTTGIAPSHSILLASTVASGGAITSTKDRRKVGFSVFSGYQPQALTEVSVPANSVGTTNLVNVSEQGQLMSILWLPSSLGGAGSTTLTLTIQIDGSTMYSLPLGVATAGGLSPSAQLQAVCGPLNAPAGGAFVFIALNIFYRVSCKVELNSSGTVASGSYLMKVQRAKAV